MEKLVFAFAAGVAVSVMGLILPLLGILFGALGGWVAGLFFEQTIRAFLAATGFNASGLAMWQIGAGFGFVGSYFRATLTTQGGK